MYRLRGSDAQLIYNESSDSPFETLKAMIYEPTTEGGVPKIDDIRRFVKNSVSKMSEKGMTYRVMRVPFDLHHPMWVKDPNFNIDDHIHHVALPAPGDHAQLCNFISYILSMPMDPNRPLWESWIVEGLEGGKVAIVFKLHHALADGLTSVNWIMKSHLEEDVSYEHNLKHSINEPIPSKPRLLFDGLIDLVKSYTVELPEYFRHLKEARAGGSAVADEEHEEASGPFTAPFTIFNVKGGPYRIYQYESMSLSSVKALSKKLDCTINTLVMGLCAEAFRKYLGEVDAIPTKPLVTAMPVGLHGKGEMKILFNAAIQNNSLTVAFVPLDLTIVNFEERLKSIRHGSQLAIDSVHRTNGRRLDNYFDFLPGSIIRVLQWVMRRRQKNKRNPFASVGISNVPGPRDELYAVDGQLKMTELLSCGNLADPSNLNITVWSYVDRLCFSFLYRKDAMPDPTKINRYLVDTYEELCNKHIG